MMISTLRTYYLLLIAIVLTACTTQTKQDKTVIVISKGAGSEHYLQYPKWLSSNAGDVECIDLYYIKSKEKLDSILSKADGLLLSGGPDIHPGRYGREFDTVRCYIDSYRDTLEFYLIDYAKKHNLPILGICRGLQILNVAYGGTLFVDIPEDYGRKVVHSNDTDYCEHIVTLSPETMLSAVTGMSYNKVTSFHHQGVKILADDFIVNARSEDGFIEGCEFKEKRGKQFLLAVQWHPERLFDISSKKIAIEFIKECRKYSENKKTMKEKR